MSLPININDLPHSAALEVAESAAGAATSPVRLESGLESRLESGSESRSESRPESRPESEGEWRSRPEWRAGWGLESIHHRIMVALSDFPLGRSEITHALGHKSASGAAKLAIADLMQAGLVEYTIPEKPNSRLQKYRIVQGERAIRPGAWVITRNGSGE